MGSASGKIRLAGASFVLAILALFCSDARGQQIAPQALQQIQALRLEKASWTAAERKIDSNLVIRAKRARGVPLAAQLPDLQSAVEIDALGTTRVDITATVTNELLALIEALGGSVINSYPQYKAIRAVMPVEQLEALAAEPSVTFIRPAYDPLLHKDNTSQADVTHRANLARSTFGVNGTGVKVGVLSDSVDALAALQASGDLPAVTVLPGQSGNPGSSEGTALLEIVFDLAPGAALFYATAFSGQASFAANIIALQEAGCDVIIDDVGYFAEYVFQDGIIAQAVETVSGRGASYFSSAGNSGNFNDGTSGVWEGDFVLSAGDPFGDGTPVHNFSTSGDTTFNTITVASSSAYTLQWSDPAGASANDYDLFLINSAGTSVVAASQNVQNGSQDPFEIIGAGADAGRHLLISKAPGAVARYLHVNTNRGRLSIATNGQTSGHSAAQSAFSVAAVYWATAGGVGGVFDGSEAIEAFSSDGPRRVFFEADGTAITPGDFSATGGTVRSKPDVTAADGVSTATPGFDPFFGTSAAAPHAGAIAALLYSQGVATTPAGIRQVLFGTSLDIEAPGVDNDSGAGIVDALAALTFADDVLSVTPRQGLTSSGAEGGTFSPLSETYTLTNNGGTTVNWTASSSESWVGLSSLGGSLAPSASIDVTAALNAAANALLAGTHTGLITFTHPGAAVDQIRLVHLTVHGVDHFDWATIPSPQVLATPFSVTVTAKDSEANTVAAFTGTVDLSGQIGVGKAPSIVISEMNPGSPDNVEFTNVSGQSLDISNWAVTLYDTLTWPSPLTSFTIPASTVTAAGAVFTLEEFGTAPGSYPSFFLGLNIDWTRSSTFVGVLLQDQSGAIIDFATTGVSGQITSPLSIPAEQWSGPGIPTTRGNRTYQRTGNSDNNGNSDWTDANGSVGTINAGLTVPFPSLITPVNLSPAVSGSFVAGVWTGSVTVLEEAVGMHIEADDVSGRTGASNTFDVVGGAPSTVDAAAVPQGDLVLPDWKTTEASKMSVLKFRITDKGGDSLPTLIDEITVDISGTAGQAANDIAWAELRDGAARIALATSITNTAITFGSSPNSDSVGQLDSVPESGQVEYTVFLFLSESLAGVIDETYIFDINETHVGVDLGNSSPMAGDTGSVVPVVGTLFITAIGITVTPGVWNVGPRPLGAVLETGPFSVQNTGNVAEDFAISASDGSNAWVLAGAPGQDAFNVDADRGDDGSYETVLTVSDQPWASAVPVSGTESLGLRYRAPTGDTQGGGVSHDFEVVVRASRHVP